MDRGKIITSNGEGLTLEEHCDITFMAAILQEERFDGYFDDDDIHPVMDDAARLAVAATDALIKASNERNFNA